MSATQRGERLLPSFGETAVLLGRRESRGLPGRRSFLVSDLAPAALLAAFVCAVTPLALADEGAATPELDLGAYLLCAIAGLSLAVRRRLPLATYGSTVACAAAFAVLYHGGPIFVTALAALPFVVASRPRREWAPLVAAGMVVISLSHMAEEGPGFGVVVIAAVWLGTAVLFAELVAARRAEAEESRARAEQAERRREEETGRRLAEERLRIAREVHDVVGHGLAAISLQAGVAEHLLDARPEEARRSLATIRLAAKTALDELRAEIGALRDGGAAEAQPLRRPTPGLDALPSLVATMRGAGLAIELDLAVRPGDPLPDAVQTAAYRIVQEALTNVVRHAGAGARAAVRVAESGDGLEVEVIDDGPGARAGASADAGNGLTGMQERAAALGGSFAAGAAPGGGFRVWAALPARPA